jgi:hypothetical protein
MVRDIRDKKKDFREERDARDRCHPLLCSA